MFPIRIFLSLLVLFIFPVSVFADEECYLTRDNMSRFVDSLPEVKRWNANISPELRQETVSYDNNDMRFAFDDAISPFQAIMQTAHNSSLKAELDEIVRKYGFSGTDEWAKVGGRVSDAYLAINGNFNNNNAQKALGSSENRIEDTNNMPIGYQSVMLDIMDTAHNSMDGINSITPQEINIVKSDISIIETVFRE